MVAQSESAPVTHPLHVLKQAAKVGALCVLPGFAVGAFTGTLRTKTPILFALVSSVQWFSIGTTFWTVRSSILDDPGLRNWWNITRGAPLIPPPDSPPSSSDKVRASAISGGVTGAVLGAAFRGPRNVIPGTIMFTLLGWSGQHAYEFFDQRNTREMTRQRRLQEEGEKDPNWMQRIAKKKWSPMSVLSDEKYEEMLKEKILALDVDIALIDDRIAEQRQKQKELEQAAQQSTDVPQKK